MNGLKQGINIQLGEKLRELRKSRKLTQEQLAGELDTNPNYISAIERGERGAGSEIISRYCNFFGIREADLSQFLQRKDAGYPPLVKMVIDELLEMPDYEQARLLADLKERKEKRKTGH